MGHSSVQQNKWIVRYHPEHFICHLNGPGPFTHIKIELGYATDSESTEGINLPGFLKTDFHLLSLQFHKIKRSQHDLTQRIVWIFCDRFFQRQLSGLPFKSEGLKNP